MRYLGSKRRIANEILPIMLDGMQEGNYFVDAFCGGCNLIDKVPQTYHRLANDNNEYLIEMWKGIMRGENYPILIDRDYYSSVREAYNKRQHEIYPVDLIGWVGFMASSKGRFFDGGYSGHNAKGKDGKERDYVFETIRNIMAQKQHLHGVRFTHASYKEIVLPPADRAVIYCDIPYKGTKKYSSSMKFDYEEFYDWCREKHKNGDRIYVSEYSMPKDFKCIWSKEIKNSVSNENTHKVTEKLFTL